MKISCPSCSAKYSVADEKIQARLAKIRCRKCSATIVIDGTASPANVYVSDGAQGEGGRSDRGQAGAGQGSVAPSTGADGGFGAPGDSQQPVASEQPPGPAPNEYAVDIADNDQRNLTLEQIVAAYNEGAITGDTYVWKEGMADWQTVAEVPEVASALQAAAGPAPGRVADPAASPEMPAAAVASASTGSDLFGGIEQAGGENDIATSAPEPEPSPEPTAGTGARNESSVLFSLSALTAAEESEGGQVEKGGARSDDSGLIDLQALTAGGGEASPGSAPLGAGGPVGGFAASPLISAPLGGVSGPAVDPSITPGYGGKRSGGRMAMILGVVAAALVAVAGLIFFVRGGGEPTAASAQRPVAASPSAAAPALAAKAAAPSEPARSAEPAVAAEAAPATAVGNTQPAAAKALPSKPSKPAAKPAPVRRKAPRKRVTRRASSSKPAASKPKTAPKPAAAKPKKKKKRKKKACNCKPADLMCAMRCSAKK